MSYDTFLAIVIFAVASFFTPGPNNLMLMTSGVNFGVVRTLPHLAGVVTGFPLMVGVIGIGLSGLFAAWPPAMTVLKVVSVAYTLWLAWKIAHAAAPHERVGEGRPLTSLQAVGFQWVNPKAWSMALSVIALYAGDRKLSTIAIIVALFFCIGIFSSGGWMLMGTAIRGWLSNPARLRIFNWTMAALLVASIALAL